MATTYDHFAPIASHYDAIMSHVDYDRWAITAAQLQRILPKSVDHLDVACGTGTFVNRMRKQGWNSIGTDISESMIASTVDSSFSVSDMRALPYKSRSFDCVSCLFDSINFLLTPMDLARAVSEFYRMLRPGGLLYIDAVTERMVLDHFADQEWTEVNDGFDTTWRSTYSRSTGLSETTVHVAGREPCVIREQIYPSHVIEGTLANTGFTLFDVVDAESWRKPTRRTVRVEYISARSPVRGQRSEFNRIVKRMREVLKQ